jgi:hypothetical protein
VNILVLFQWDPTISRVPTEVTFLNRILESLGPSNVICLTTFKTIKKIQRLASLINCSDVRLFDGTYPDVDLVFTWTSADNTNFFGGHIPDRKLNYFRILSHYTNSGVPVLMRHCDSRYNFKDLQQVAFSRFYNTRFCEINAVAKVILENTPPINYDNTRLLLNGNKDDCDWSKELTIKVEPIFLGDDIFFDVSNQFKVVSKFDKVQRDNSLSWFGFLSDSNKPRINVLKSLVPMNDIHIYADIEVKGLNVDVGHCVSGTEEMYNRFRKHRAFVYIGKGDGKFAYRGKTVYDSIVSQTPVFILESADKDHKCFPGVDCYFKDGEDLAKLNARTNADELLKIQTKFIKSLLKKENESAKLAMLQLVTPGT